MNDAISSIDAENIEKNVTEAYKSVHKAIKQFQDAESKINKIKTTNLIKLIATEKKNDDFFIYEEIKCILI